MFVSESTVGSDWKRLSVLYDFATQYLRSYFLEDVFWNLVTKFLTSLTSASIIYEAVKEVRLVEIIHFLHFVILTQFFHPINLVEVEAKEAEINEKLTSSTEVISEVLFLAFGRFQSLTSVCIIHLNNGNNGTNFFERYMILILIYL